MDSNSYLVTLASETMETLVIAKAKRQSNYIYIAIWIMGNWLIKKKWVIKSQCVSLEYILPICFQIFSFFYSKIFMTVLIFNINHIYLLNTEYYTVVCFLKSNAQEFTQNRTPVGFGPSSKTWPRWALQSPHLTSIRWIPKITLAKRY